MPVLPNPRHERYAQLFFAGLANGITQEEAYSAAGYQVRNKPARKANASRLMHTIANRVKELQAEAFEREKHKIDLSRDRVGRRLDLASRIAEEERNASAIATSEMGIAKVFGHITDKLAIEKDDKDKPQNSDDIARQLLADVGLHEPDEDAKQRALQAFDTMVATLE